MADSVFNRYRKAFLMKLTAACLLMLLVVHIMKDPNVLKATVSNVGKMLSIQLPNSLKDFAETENPTLKAPLHPVIKEFNGTADDDPEMVEYVKSKKLIPPSTDPYNLKNENKIDNSQFRQTPVLAEILHNMKGGFFVEAGAHNGESLSNTLYFERSLNWTGLLIEMRDQVFKDLLSKNRKAYAIGACLSLHPFAEIVQFRGSGFIARIAKTMRTSSASVQCYPLYTLMLALGRTQIDLLSLDIEGDELKVLKTIPWDKMQIRLMLIEATHIKEGKQELIRYMESVGYILVKELRIDLIFAKQDLLDQAGQ